MAPAGFQILKDYQTAWLTNLGYDPLPIIDPGPGPDRDALDLSPASLLLLTIGPGAGLSTEGAFDRPSVQVRAIGEQSDYASAEKLAFDVDTGFVLLDHSQSVGGRWFLSMVRSGGGPALLLKDDADRYHFTCNYIYETEARLNA